MASPTSTTASANPYANPTPGGSGGAAAAAQIIAPVAPGQPGPIIQIDQKKVPIFCGEPGKDGIDIREWTRRIDSMKTAFGWTKQATYKNARAALTHPMQEVHQRQLRWHLDMDEKDRAHHFRQCQRPPRYGRHPSVFQAKD
jgi:hypothetical protein